MKVDYDTYEPLFEAVPRGVSRKHHVSTSCGKMFKMRNHEDSLIIVIVTCPDAKTARRIVSSVIRKRLAACVNIVKGVKSVYRWKGKGEETSEELLLIKSSRRLLNKITRDVRQNHPYQIPEIVALPIIGGSREYLRWLTEEIFPET